MHPYIVWVYRARPEDTESASGIIEDVESGLKASFHGISELQTMLAHSIGKGQLGLPDLVTRESGSHDKVAMAG